MPDAFSVDVGVRVNPEYVVVVEAFKADLYCLHARVCKRFGDVARARTYLRLAHRSRIACRRALANSTGFGS
jgi:hypothetical protein